MSDKPSQSRTKWNSFPTIVVWFQVPKQLSTSINSISRTDVPSCGLAKVVSPLFQSTAISDKLLKLSKCLIRKQLIPCSICTPWWLQIRRTRDSRLLLARTPNIALISFCERFIDCHHRRKMYSRLWLIGIRFFFTKLIGMLKTFVRFSLHVQWDF